MTTEDKAPSNVNVETGSSSCCCYSDEEIMGFDMLELSEILEQNGINYENLETEQEMRELLLSVKRGRGHSTENKSSSVHEIKFTSEASQQGAEVIGKILENDLKRKTCLKELYDDIEKFMKDKSLDPKLKEELMTEFGDIVVEVGRFREELMQEQCPIVVAGETTAGKSSLLNLLLGNDVLPHSLLTCTSTICRLWNKEKKAVYVVDEHDKRRDLKLPTDMDATYMKEQLHKYVVTDAAQNQYKFVDIHWPIPILQKQAIIVDTPGIGSSDELTKRLEDYLPNAIAFIYVINSSNAGGVQGDRLLRIFEVQKKEGKMYEFDPTRAIFVCNKWDQVPAEEDDKVWNNTANKLQENWPNFHMKQMFKLSTKEEMRRAATPGLQFTEKFQKLLQGISEMIPASLEAKVSRHSRWQKHFLEQLLKRIVGRIKLSRKDEDEKKKMKNDIEDRIKLLQHELKGVKERVMEQAEAECMKISQDLYGHLNSKKTWGKMFLWKLSELPSGADIEVIEYQSKKLIVERINTETRTWCTKNNVNDLTKNLTDLFKAECRLLDNHYEEINRALLDISMPLEEGLHDYENSMEGLSSDPLFTKHEKIVLAVTSPLWLPLVIGAGLIALPFGVAAGLKDLVKQTQKINEYNSNKLKFMMEWCKDVLALYNTNAIFGIMEETYLADFNSKVQNVCENLIPHQIEADKKFINNIKNELRSSCDIRNQYLPMERSCKCLLGKLLLIYMDYFSGYKLLKENIRNYGVEEIGKGQFSDVHSAEVLVDGRWTKAAVKTLRRSLEKTESYVQLTEVQNLRNLCHPNIVELYGVSYRLGSKGKKFLQIYMEFCDNSLENVVYRERNPPPCFSFKDVSQCKASWEFYLKVMCDVCNGLVHIHSKGFVHRDLKLANILIKNGEAKIADVGLLKEVDNILGTVAGTPTTMAPEVLSGKFYGAEADIYSFGVVLWEMWYARPAYTIPTGNKSDEYQFIAKNFNELSYHISNGTRPDFETKHRPGHALQVLMRKCWDGNVNERPIALKVLEELKYMSRA